MSAERVSGTPRVSVVVPFRDPPPAFFREALESVVRQSFASWELILVNDGSGEAALTIAREYCERFPGRIHTVAHPGNRNLGLRASRLQGFRHSAGEYIALLDADDLWLPRKLEEQVDLLDRHPAVALVYGRSRYWRSWKEDGSADFEPDLGVASGTRVDPPGLVPLFLRGAIAVPAPSSILARRSSVLAAEAFDGAFPNMYEDQVFLFKMCLHAPAMVIPRTWDYYRLHERAMTAALPGHALRAARRVFLEWLSAYVEGRGLDHPAVRSALAAELRDVVSPRKARVRRFIARRFGRKPRPRGAPVV